VQLYFYSRLATGWTVRGSNNGGGQIFPTRPDQHWGPPSLLYNAYYVSFPRVKYQGGCIDHTPQPNAKAKERVQLYLNSTSGSSWPVPGSFNFISIPLLYLHGVSEQFYSKSILFFCCFYFCWARIP